MGDTMSMTGKTALVTGGAARVGAAIARRLHAAGAHVVVHYRSSRQPAEALREELEAARAGSASVVRGDLLDIASLPRLVAAAAAATGRLDLLVNNASTYYPTPLGQITPEQWHDLMGTNAQAPLFLAQAAAPLLRDSHGAIVNLVDIHALRPHRDHPVYCMAKAANAMLVRALARDLAPDVRVNGVAPGAVLWPSGYQDDAERQAILERIPLGRPGEPQDVAAAVLFLATAPYVTGQILPVDGGRTVQQ